MYFFWLVLMSSQPYLLILGLLGVFGKDGEKAANDLCVGIAILAAIALIVFVLYLLLHAVGIVG